AQRSPWSMEVRHGTVGRVWIVHRGMASRENLSWLRQTGRQYFIDAPEPELKKSANALAHLAPTRSVGKGVQVKLTRCPDMDATAELCCLAERHGKEQAMPMRIESAPVSLTTSYLLDEVDRAAKSRLRMSNRPGLSACCARSPSGDARL